AAERRPVERAAGELDRTRAGRQVDGPDAPWIEPVVAVAATPTHPPGRRTRAAPGRADLAGLGANPRGLGRAIVAPRAGLSQRTAVGTAPTVDLPASVHCADVLKTDRDSHGVVHRCRDRGGLELTGRARAQARVAIVPPAADRARGGERTDDFGALRARPQRAGSVEHRHAARDPLLEVHLLRDPERRAPAEGGAVSGEATRKAAPEPDVLDGRQLL